MTKKLNNQCCCCQRTSGKILKIYSISICGSCKQLYYREWTTLINKNFKQIINLHATEINRLIATILNYLKDDELCLRKINISDIDNYCSTSVRSCRACKFRRLLLIFHHVPKIKYDQEVIFSLRLLFDQEKQVMEAIHRFIQQKPIERLGQKSVKPNLNLSRIQGDLVAKDLTKMKNKKRPISILEIHGDVPGHKRNTNNNNIQRLVNELRNEILPKDYQLVSSQETGNGSQPAVISRFSDGDGSENGTYKFLIFNLVNVCDTNRGISHVLGKFEPVVFVSKIFLNFFISHL